MNKYFFFNPHSANTNPSHKDPFYSQKVHHEESTEENITDTSANDIPEVVTEPESINETNLEYHIEATEGPSIKTNSKLMDESVYKDALKLLSKITKEKTELRDVTTVSSFSEAKYRGNVEEPSPPMRHSTESFLGDRIVYDQCKYQFCRWRKSNWAAVMWLLETRGDYSAEVLSNIALNNSE